MDNKTVQIVAGIVLGLAGLLHLYRAIFSVPLIIGSWGVPVILSIGAVVVAGGLSILLLKNAFSK